MTQLEDSWLDSVNFDAQGNATIEFDDYTIAPGSAGSIVVTVPSANIIPLLSPFGLMARTAAMNPVPRIPAGFLGSARPGEPTQTARGSGRRARREPRNIDCSKTKCVALTFDDGPGPKTGKLLDELKKKNAAATFFVVGPNAKTRPEIIERMIAEGHEVGNHTWSHRSLPALSPAQVRSEIDRTNEAISAAIDQPATLLRPPYGARNPTTDRLAQAPVILWDVDTLDWKYKNTEKVVDAAVSQTKPGSIVLMHDIHSSTVAAVPEILSRLKAKGYTFVTVTELLGKDKLKSGETYSRAPLPTAGPFEGRREKVVGEFANLKYMSIPTDRKMPSYRPRRRRPQLLPSRTGVLRPPWQPPPWPPCGRLGAHRGQVRHRARARTYRHLGGRGLRPGSGDRLRPQGPADRRDRFRPRRGHGPRRRREPRQGLPGRGGLPSRELRR